MSKISLIFGSDSGCTEEITQKIVEKLGDDVVEVKDVYDVSTSDFDGNKFILGLSTWYDGELQSAWEEFYDEFKTIDFTGKTVAIFGLGDQIGYGEFFCDGVGILGDVVKRKGGKLVGEWPIGDTYEYDESKADLKNGNSMGLLLDEDNQPEFTDERLGVWLELIKPEFGL